MSIGPLVCGVSTGQDVADTVNALIAENGFIQDPVMGVDPVDFYDVRLMVDFGGAGYGVNLASSGQIVKVNLQDGTQENYGTPVPVGNLQNIAFMPDGTCFAEGHSGDNFYKLYRSTDNGLTWFLSNTQTIAQVWGARNRGIAKFKDMILYAEYNVNSARTPGGANDRIRLRKSIDNGTTWQDVIVWNTDGTTRNVRHLHGVVVSKDGQYAYIMTGDTNRESAIIRWDGVTPIPDNTPVENVKGVTGLPALAGKQVFRANDLVEDEGMLYWVSDAENIVTFQAENIGAFKAKADLTAWEKISDVTAADRGVAGRLGVLLPTGEIVFQCNNEESSTGFRYTAVVVSNKSKTVWKTVGAYRGDASQSYYYRRAFFLIGDTMYMSNDYGSGKSLETSVAFKLSSRVYRGDFKMEQSLDTIHPAYWIDPVNGSDSNNGWTPRTPFKTLEHALTGDRVPYGGVCLLPAGEYQINSVTPKSDAAPRNGDPTDYQRVQGSSDGVASLVLAAGASTSNMFNLAGTNAKRIELRNLKIGTLKDNATLITSNVASGDVNHGAKLTNCLIDGNYSSGQRISVPFVSNKVRIKFFGSVIIASNDVTATQLYTRTGGTGGQAMYTLENTAIINGGRFFDALGSGNDFFALDSKFINPINEVVRFQSASSFTARFVNCGLFTTNLPTTVAVNNQTGSALPVMFYGAYGNAPFNETAAFDGYSVNTQPYGLLVDYSIFGK